MKKHFVTLLLILCMILELSVTFTLTASAATEGVYLYNVVDGEEKRLDVPAKVINGRTLVPVRAISEAFGCRVEWVQETKTVMIK